MACLYTPVVGISELLDGIEKDADFAARALSGSAVQGVTHNIERLKHGCDVLRPLTQQFVASEAIYLPGDHGAAVAVAMRDTDLLVALITSVTDAYLPNIGTERYDVMFDVARSLKNAPAFARSIIQNLAPFISACKQELGEKDLADVTVVADIDPKQ